MLLTNRLAERIARQQRYLLDDSVATLTHNVRSASANAVASAAWPPRFRCMLPD